MDGLATISPGIGATFFGAAVVLTMMAAHAFDPRLVWDRAPAAQGVPSGVPA
jgi:paraquat-inducible protein A